MNRVSLLIEHLDFEMLLQIHAEALQETKKPKQQNRFHHKTAKKQTPTAFTKLKHGKKQHKRKTSIYNSTDPHCFQTTSLIPIP